MKGKVKMNTIYISDKDDHIKLVQTNALELVYIRSDKGEEWLCPLKYLCRLIRK